MDIDSWLKHKTTGGNGKFLRNWTKTGSCEFYFHRHSGIEPIWAHQWWKVKTYEDKKTHDEVTSVWRERYISHDPETQNVKARYRHENGLREHPPKVDPYAFMLEWIAEQIAMKKLSWVQPVFEFKGDDPAKDVVIHAGGMLNMFSGDKYTREQLREMSDARINRSQAWAEDCRVKCSHVFQVVDCSDVSAGVVIAVEKDTTTGAKLKKEIEKKIKEYKDKGNPGVNPYKFVFLYDDTQKNWGLKYAVETRYLEAPSKEILDIISDRENLHDTSHITTPYDLKAFRMEIEEYARIEMPFDSFFEPAREAAKNPRTDEKLRNQLRKALGMSENDDARTETKPSLRTPEITTSKASAPKSPAPTSNDSEEEGGPCDFCGEELGADDLDCGACGAGYQDTGDGIRLSVLKCKTCEAAIPLVDGTLDRDEANGAESEIFSCPSCSASHRLFPVLDEFYRQQQAALDAGEDPPVLLWEVVKRAEPKAEPAKARGGRRRAAGGAAAKNESAEMSKAIDAVVQGDPLPF